MTTDLTGGPWTSHGHPIPGVTVAGTGRPPVARCGGPAICPKCAVEAGRLTASPAPDLSPAEAATLARIEAAPYAPEARYRDMNFLVPTGDIRPAHEVVPAPDDGTAAQWSAYYLAQAHAAHGLGLHLMRTAGDMRQAPVDHLIEMGDAYADFAHLFAIGYLLRHVSDDVARELAGILELGDDAELTYEWLAKAGVPVEHIQSAPTRAETVAAGEARRAAVNGDPS